MRYLDDPNDIGIRFEVKVKLSNEELGELYSDEKLLEVVEYAENQISPLRAVSSNEERIQAYRLQHKLRRSEKIRIAYYVYLIKEFYLTNLTNE